MQLRLVALAHALLGSPRTLALEEPFLGLTTQDSNVVLEAIEVARGNCQLIVAVSHADPGSVERLLIDRCAEVLVLRNGALTLQGPPTRLGDGAGLFAVTLAGDAGHLREALASAGVLVRSFSPLSPEAAGAFSGQSVGRLVVELPPGQSTLPLFAAAKSSGTTLLELRALGDVE
jgi:ABC-type sulfate/molybdate transport systems ATPase subunit